MEHITFSKVRLLIILFLYSFTSYAQTTCTFDEILFSGTVTTTTAGATKFKASDATSNYRFGERVAIDGNIAATVSRSNGGAAGKVYIYINDGSGNWIQQTILTASNSSIGDNFGSAIALEGNYLVVGARSQLNSSDIDTGAAYLFEYDGSSTWTEVAIFEPSDGATGIRFGESVSIEGDLILVGARNGCTGGCAYMYENDGTSTFTYTETKLEPQVQSNYSGARFGYDVLIKNGRAYVGGPQDFSSVGNASAGSVQIWDQANDGTWSRTHRLRGTETSEYFGSGISVQGDYLAIGAYNFEVSSTPEADQGRVFVYKADINGDYLETNRVMIQNDDKDNYNDQRFGTDVALEDDFLYVGTFGNGSNSSDAVYVFKDDGTNTWTQISKITSGGGWDEFSNRAVAVSFPYLLIGQNEDDSPTNSGAVHFVSLESVITPIASVTEVTDVYIGQNNGTIKVNFDDEATRSEIKFSVDGGVTYPYVFNDNEGNAEITSLAEGSYELRVAFEGGSCVLDLGTVTIGLLPYTDIPDANFEAALDALGYDDVSSDGRVPTDYISGVTSLDVSNQNISDLTGINDFIALETLRLQYNSLTSLDVSNLANLRVLWAANGNIFSSIDVSNNLLLEDFRIRQYTGTSIDISANTALTRFACTSCDLLTVDTSTNINLSYLDLWNSDITSLDVSANVNLATLDVYSTNLLSLDLSANTALTNLIANDINTLTSLNVQNGNNVNINTFNVTNNSNLDCVLVDDVSYSTTNWIQVDTGLVFSENYCRYTAIPDSNFEAALNTLGLDDISADGQVPTALIEVITSLDVSNQNIADLTGIQDFTALQILECQSNNLNDLNISNNTELIELTTNANNITSIDLSQNIALEILIIGANDLTSIDISNNSLLKRLDILHNDITMLDTSNNSDLETLNAYNTDVVSYDFSSNPLLRNVQLYNNSSLTTLDVTNLTQLDQLRLDNTGITNLDVSNNLNLRIIRVNQSNINTLDLSNQSSLIHAYVDNSPISYLNVQNGNNTNFTQFHADNTPNLNCVLVDNVDYSTNNWTNIDTDMIFSSTYCRYTAISDANFEAILNTLGYDDIAGDGQVPTALIEVITALDISNQNIADLTGIQDFTTLTDLNVETNLLTTLDVSNNANLQILVFDNNTVSNLSLGSISTLTSIEGRYNQLATIDLSLNADLTFINLRDNLFATIDVSNNPLLETINLRGCTNLTTIDISNNPNVTSLFFQDTALNGLDVSQNPLLENIIIERVNFNEIDVSNLPNLVQLRIADNNFTELDVSNNPLLERLECENNNLSYLNLKNGNNTALNTFLATGNPSLSCILVDDATYSTTNWTNIDPASSFSDTFCRYTAIPDSVFEARLETLGYDDISGDGQVPTALIEVVTDLFVTSLSLTNITGIEDFLALENFTCSGTSVTSADLSSNTQLRVVNLSNSNINNINISNSNGLEELDLRGNNLNTINVTNNVTLLELDLSGNNITTIDLSNNSLLRILDLSDNAITSLDLSNNTDITNLNIEGVNITTIDLNTNTLLEELIFSYTTLTSLDLTNNIAITYLECIESNQLTTLDFSTLTVLEDVFLTDNALLGELKIKNSNNTNISSFEVTGSPNLTCIIVDDAMYSSNNWTDIDITTSFSDTYCRYTAIPDANFETELEALGYDDISGDGQVPTVLIEGITSLAVPNKGINDLTGIQDFIALTSLNCRLNNLTVLDVSQNILLSTLTADGNNINAIDLSNNTALEILNLAGSNLTAIDVTNNTSLRKLFIQGNGGLTSIDISNNIELVEFRTNSTNIASLDVSVHPDLELLESHGSPLTAIDVSNNLALESLRINNTNITELHVSNNINLKTLHANDTGIESLDLSNQTALQTLYAHDTNLNYLNVKNGNNTIITTFSAENNPNLTCILVDDLSYSASNWLSIDDHTSFNETSCTNDFTLALKVYLQGAALNPNLGEENLMRDDLRIAGLIPMTSPYSDGVVVLSTVFDVTGNDAIVDWVWVELRDATDGSIVSHSRSALLQRDGDIVAIDGTSALDFATIEDTYYIAIHHRNHLAIMTNAAITFTQGSTEVVDFTTTTSMATGGNLALTQLDNGSYALYAGDVNADGSVLNTDITNAISRSGGINMYSGSDANMDGNILNTDIQLIIQPNAGRIQQFD